MGNDAKRSKNAAVEDIEDVSDSTKIVYSLFRVWRDKLLTFSEESG